MKNQSQKKYTELSDKVKKLEKQLVKSKIEAKSFKVQLSQETKIRQQLEKQILKSEEKYTALFELSPSGIILEDTKGNILDANAAICKSFGYSREELLNMNVRALTSKKNVPAVKKNLDKILSGSLLCHQVENIRKDGSISYNELYESKVTMPAGEERVLTIANDVTSRRKVENFLKESERRYRALFETANDAIFLMDGEKFIDCNPKTLEMFGCKWDDIIDQSPLKFSPQNQPDGQSSKSKAIAKIKEASKGTPQFFDWTHNRLDGSLFETEVSLNKVELLTKNYVIAIVRDVTARKLNERNLRESRENYISLFNGVTAGIYRTTPQGVFINANTSLVKMLKYPDKETLLNERVTDIYVNKKERIQWMQRLNKNKENQNLETKFRCYDGSLIWGHTSARAVKSSDGKILFYEGYLRDISESKLAANKLLESQQRYLALFNNSRDSIILENGKGEILDANEAACKLFGYSRDELIGKLSIELTADSTPFKKLTSKRKITTAKPSEIIAKIADGRTIPIEISAASFNLGNQKLYISTARDISDRKVAEEKIKLYTNELKEINTQKDRLFSILAHDLKSPMTALIGYADLLDNEFGLLSSEEIKDYISSISQVSQNLNNLLQTILEWSILQKDKISFEPKRLNLKTEVEQIIKLFRVSSSEKKIDIINKLDPKLFVNADPNVFHTILRNLISNAIKFSNEGGKVNIAARIKNDLIEISVEDNGIGMTQQTLKNLFTNGIQTPVRGTKNETGSGLGLLICSELIAKSDCKIIVKSKKNKGSKFIVSIPND